MLKQERDQLGNKRTAMREGKRWSQDRVTELARSPGKDARS